MITKKYLTILIAFLLCFAALIGFFLVNKTLEERKNANLVVEYATLIEQAITAFDSVSDTAALDQARPAIDAACAAYGEWSQRMTHTVFTMKEGQKYIERIEALDQRFRTSRGRMLTLFDAHPERQKEWVERLKSMPHLQTRIDGTLELEREYRHLYADPK